MATNQQMDLNLTGDAAVTVLQQRIDNHRLRESRNDAYVEQLPKLTGKRLKILEIFAEQAANGGTIKEIAAIGFYGNSNWVTQPMQDLRQARYIETTDERRDRGEVHRITERGRTALTELQSPNTQSKDDPAIYL